MASDNKTTPHPMQPVIRAPDGVIRFKANAIIEWLFETRKLDLNEIASLAARGQFSREDQMQIAQLLGYSVSGYGDLSYASDESVAAADAEADRLQMTDAPRTTRDQNFIAPWSGKPEPPPRATSPGPHFRIKNGVLQQLHSHPGGGRTRWWINVPVVDKQEADVILG